MIYFPGHGVDPCGSVRCLGAWFSGGHRDEAGQAVMVARQILVDALAGVAMTFIYDYKDDGTQPEVSCSIFDSMFHSRMLLAHACF